MYKNTILALAATASIATAVAPVGAEARNRYDQQGRYVQPVSVSRGDVWQGRDGRYYCRRENGTIGLVIGAAGGALVGRAIDTRGDRVAGTIIGAAAGALIGRELEKTLRCR